MRTAAIECFTANPGVELIFGASQSLGVLSKVHDHLIREYGGVFAQRNDGNDGNYLKAAIINAVNVALGRTRAMNSSNYFEKHMTYLMKTKELARFFHQASIKLEVQMFQVTP